MRQMSYSMCRFWAYDESKKLIGAGTFSLFYLAISFLYICLRVYHLKSRGYNEDESE